MGQNQINILKKNEIKVIIELEKLIKRKFRLVESIRDTGGIIPLSSIDNRHITGFQMHTCGISTLPKSIGNLTTLEEVNLGFNILSTLPEIIGQLSSLKNTKFF